MIAFCLYTAFLILESIIWLVEDEEAEKVAHAELVITR